MVSALKRVQPLYLTSHLILDRRVDEGGGEGSPNPKPGAKELDATSSGADRMANDGRQFTPYGIIGTSANAKLTC